MEDTDDTEDCDEDSVRGAAVPTEEVSKNGLFFAVCFRGGAGVT